MNENIFLLESIQTLQDDPIVIDLTYTKSDVEDIKEWIEDTGILVITPTEDADELDEMWSQWQQMSDTQQQSSDTKSMEVFGITNYDHYIGLKNKIYGNTKFNNDYNSDYDQYITTESSLYVYENDSQEVKNIKKNIIKELSKESIDNLSVAALFISLNNLSGNLSDKVLQAINNESVCIDINSFPFFTVSEMANLGIFSNKENNYYNILADNNMIGQGISTKEWFREYCIYSEGFVTENFDLYNKLWTQKLNELYSDFDKIKESGDINKINARKQSILELGWNPEIDFSVGNRLKSTNRITSLLEFKYNKLKVYNISNLAVDSNDQLIQDDSTLYPVYIVLSYTYTVAGKVISTFTNSIYSHTALALDPVLDKLYSYNMKNGNNGGFSLESLKGYINKDDKSRIAVYVLFVKKKDIQNIRLKLDYYISNIKNTSYSLGNIFNIVMNKPILKSNSDTMICSQFVDFILKSINVDITNKQNDMVIPKDFLNIQHPKVYKVYEGLAKDYDIKRVTGLVNRLKNKDVYIKESMEIINESQYINMLMEGYNNMDILIGLNERVEMLSEQNREIYKHYIRPYLEAECIYEAKEFPVQFDQEGNLLIKNIKQIDFENEYAKSHKLLLAYEEKENYEGIAYEISKLWFLNEVLEQRIYNEKTTDSKLKQYHKARAKILNDYKKYLHILLANNKDFNFTEYYNSSPFSDVQIKVNNTTIKYSGEALKNIVKLLL